MKRTDDGGTVYRPVRPQTPERGAVFFVEYLFGTPAAPEVISLAGEGGELLELTDLPKLPPTAEGTRVILEYPLPSGFVLETIVVGPSNGGSGDSEYRPLERVGFRPGNRGVIFSETSITLAAGYGISWSGDELTLTLPRADSAVSGEGSGRSFELAYEGAPNDEGTEPVRLVLGGAGGERTALLTPRRGDTSLFFHPGVWNGEIDRITLRGIDGSFRPTFLAPVDPPASPDLPIDLDAGSIMKYDPAEWRREEYELFRWNLFPSILIFDTRDYAVQAGFFKRLAFFVEKRGYVGTLLSDGELEGKHGWNAHDYRAIDLAAFFQAAADRHFELSPEEKGLEEILIENGIIRYDGGIYLPGEGGVISLSRESSGYLRRKFLVHEGYHGVFFASGEFRDRCFELFDARPQEERRFWSDFLGLMGYGVENRYLLVNEYQAYLLQQPLGQAEGYFRSHWASRRLAGEDRLFAAGTFTEAAGEMENAVYKLFGLTAGEIFCLDGFE